MDKSAIRSTFPYVVGLAVAAVLFYFARDIQYTARPGMLGPDFWPKAAIGLMAIVCLFEIVRTFAGLKSETHGVAEILEKDADEEPAKTYPRLLIGGIVLVTVYAIVVDRLGFLLSTFLFLAAFMYLGRYRRSCRGVEHKRRCHAAGGADFHPLCLCVAAARPAAIRRHHRRRSRHARRMRAGVTHG